jgi:hypothetical protein
VDATNILHAGASEVRVSCERCRHSESVAPGELVGKLSWKLDCAARWNLYGTHVEVFSKAHLADLGTLGIARLMSQEYFGGVCPEIVPYGEVRLDPELSYRLLEILPPDLLKGLFVGQLRRDLDLTKDFIENYCLKATVGDGVPYVDYVRRELPRRLLWAGSGYAADGGNAGRYEPLDDPELLEAARHFARFYYEREHALGLPDVAAARSEDPAVAARARDAVRHALSVRAATGATRAAADGSIRAWLSEAALPDGAYHLIRRICGQEQGPRLATLLTLLPMNYLELVDQVLELCARNGRAEAPANGREWSSSGGPT